MRKTELTRNYFELLDKNDSLAGFRKEFSLPKDKIYLDGNSLGAMPVRAMEIAIRTINQEWGAELIQSWNTAGWFQLPQRLGDKVARLIGADAGEVVVTDSVSINLFKVLAAALTLNSERNVIVVEGSNFPTDNYIAQGLAQFIDRGIVIRSVEKHEILDAIDTDVAVVSLCNVHYKTGHILDMQAITSKAHDSGALMIWDLCHSAGAMPVDLNGCGADFAVGCTYKYLNGGPGSPAFVYCARRLQKTANQPLFGWWGHAEPFAFEPDYRRAGGINQMLSGTQPIVSLAMLEAGLDIALGADLNEVRKKSAALGELFIGLIENRCSTHGFELQSPRSSNERGSQVSFSHVEAYAIMQALIARGVVGDFRAPDILRFGFTPLYTQFVDVWDAVEVLETLMVNDEWQRDVYQTRHVVT